MNYGEILASSMGILRNHKRLLAFGFFISLDTILNKRIDLSKILNLINDQSLNVWAVGMLLCVLGISLYALSTLASIALTRGVWQADEGAVKLSIGELLHGSLPFFWTIIY